MPDNIADKIQSLLSDEESMNQIRELAAMFGGMSGNAETNASPPAGTAAEAEGTETAGTAGSTGSTGFDPFAIISLLNTASAKDKDCELLLALKPHLSPERQRRTDKAVKLLKLYNIFTAMRDNGMLNDLEKLL